MAWLEKKKKPLADCVQTRICDSTQKKTTNYSGHTWPAVVQPMTIRVSGPFHENETTYVSGIDITVYYM